MTIYYLNDSSTSGDQINEIPKQLVRKTYNHKKGKKDIQIYFKCSDHTFKVRIRLMRTLTYFPFLPI